MSLVVVEIADMKVSSNPEATLVTYALGSCIAVIVHDAKLRAGGMIHYMLPLSETSPDTGIPMLFHAMYALGCKKENLMVKVTGGGSLYDDNGRFQIGQRNYTILRKMFWKAGVMVTAEDVGGTKSRTPRLFINSGRCTITSAGEEVEL